MSVFVSAGKKRNTLEPEIMGRMTLARYASASVAILVTLWAIKRGAVDEDGLPVPDGTDPDYTIDISLLDEALSWPAQVEKPKGVVLLVHGTGVTWVLSVHESTM